MGDQGALAVLYDRHVQKLYAYGRKFSANSDQVKDCLQDLFSDLLQKPTSVSETASVKNYLMKALRRRLLTESQRRPFWSINDDYAFDLLPSAEYQLIAVESRAEEETKIKKAIARLTKRQQEIVYLKFYHDLDNQSIAEIMSLTYQAVCNLISRALKAMREILTGHLLVWLGLLMQYR